MDEEHQPAFGLDNRTAANKPTELNRRPAWRNRNESEGIVGTRINVLGAAPHIITDFGEGYVRADEDERSAAIRIYRSWCLDTPGDTVEPDIDLEVVLHDV